MVITEFDTQPFRLDQKVIVEKRTDDGALDLRGQPQPPIMRPGGCCSCHDGLCFRDVYKLFFLDEKNKDRASASWADLKAWLDERGWKLRPKTW
jgi:hypothetical protein